MRLFHELRGATDVILLATTARSAEKYERDDTYGPLALSLAGQVLNGSCDPLVAEAALNDHSTAESEDFVNTAKGERGAKALERLVSSGILDALFAENVLDRSFSQWSVREAAEHITSTDE